MTKGRAIHYSDDELAWLEENAAWPRAVLHEIFVMLFERPDVSPDHIKSLCHRRGWKAASDGRLQKGNVPPNKGRKGYHAPGSEKGWFKPGVRRGAASKNYKPIGFERLSKEGFVERKIHDDFPLQSRWRAVHLIRWEELHGPIPAEHCLKCLDGDRTNTDPSNWELVHRGVLLRLNGGPKGRHLAYDDAAPEVRPALIAVAKLAVATRKCREAA